MLQGFHIHQLYDHFSLWKHATHIVNILADANFLLEILNDFSFEVQNWLEIVVLFRKENYEIGRHEGENKLTFQTQKIIYVYIYLISFFMYI